MKKPMPEKAKHGASAYSNYGCRCEVCRAEWSRYTRTQRRKRRDKRVVVDGRMVATYLPEESHGKEATYTNYSCRCAACTEAQRVGAARRLAENRKKLEEGSQ